MILSDRLRAIREAKQLSQGVVAERTAVTRSYLSRVENGNIVPNIETLEKWAGALAVPLYRLFYDGEEPPVLPNLPGRISADEIARGSSGKAGRGSKKRTSSRMT